MSENISGNKNSDNNEIDLMDLFRRMGNALKKLGKTLGRAFLVSIVFLVRRWLPLTLSIIAGVGASYLLKSASESFYTSDMVFRNNMALMDKKTLIDNSGTTAEIISKINKLHNFCVEKNLPALSNALSMKAESAKNISDISAFWIIDQSRDGIPDFVDYRGSHNPADTVNIIMQDRIAIRAKINSPQDLKHVQDGIISFLNSDSLFQQRNRLRIKQNQDLLARVNLDIVQIDSLAKVKYFEETRNLKPATGGQIVFMQDQKTQLLYNDIYALYAKKQLLESEGNLYKGVVTILSDFSLPARRDNGGMYYGKYVIPAAFAITLLILIVLANKKKLDEIFKEY
jgi:hypothetical protein